MIDKQCRIYFINPKVYIFQEAEKKEWTQEEQTRLEQALRTYGPKEEERWDKIQKAVPTRTKRECKCFPIFERLQWLYL